VEYLVYPFQIDHLGRTKVTNLREHIKQLIEQTLFTSPGERVNLPFFGCRINELLFAPNSPELLAEVTNIVYSSLIKYLSDLVTIENVTIENSDATIAVTVAYTIKRNQLKQTVTFRRIM
jgi:uncharacterized protein